MKKLMQIAGLAGLAIIGLGGAVGLVQQRLSMVVIVHLAVGTGLAVAGALANAPEIREFLAKKSVRMGPQAFFQAVLLLLILVFLNIIIFRHDFSKDMTRRNLFTFSRVTVEVMENLPGKVEVIAFFPGGGASEERARLQLYGSRFPKVKLRFVDPDKNEDLARAEEIPPEPGVLFKYGEKKVWISKCDEQSITNAFIKATRTITPRVWFTTGHNEPGLELASPNGLSYLNRMLQEQGYEPETVDLSTLESIPQDVSMVAIIGPSFRLSNHEIKILDYYLGQGGNAIIFLDPVWEEATVSGLENFLVPYGVGASWNLVFDPEHHMARDRLGIWLVTTNFRNHPITAGLSEYRAVFYLSRSLVPMGNIPENLEVSPLVNSSSDSYEKVIDPRIIGRFSSEAERTRYVQGIMEAGPGPKERKGPHILALAVTKRLTAPKWKEEKDRDQEMRLVAVGTSAVCRNMAIYMPYNYELLINAFNWLAGEKDLKFIRSPRRAGTRIYLDDEQRDRILYISVMILPEVFMIVGLAVWWRRR